MRQHFILAGGASAHIFDGTLLQTNRCIVYRVAIESFGGAELKILSDGFSRLITPGDNIPVVDIVIGRHLYLEAMGDGEISGFYQAIFAAG